MYVIRGTPLVFRIPGLMKSGKLCVDVLCKQWMPYFDAHFRQHCSLIHNVITVIQKVSQY